MRNLCFGLLLFVAAFSAVAQVGGTGTIQGTVTDPSGANVAGATVTAVNIATLVETARRTTEAGVYVISLLPAGQYRVIVKAPGFQTLTQENVVVDALANVGLNLKLQIGKATDSITVEAAPTMLKTDDVALGSSVENNVYDALPLAMNAAGSPRDPSSFAGLASGVSNYSTQAAGPSTGSFNGGQTYQNEVYIEGLPLTSAGTEGDTRNLAFGVSVEAVDQFQVETAGAKAMYEGQGVENYVLKSGTNQFHGGVYEYFRNTDFDARGFIAAVVPADHQNEFGANVSGPIRKNKLFFFGNYDGYRLVSATTPVGYQSIPTTDERQGNFSAFPQVIYDPLSATGTAPRTPFSGNAIPSTRISKISQSFQSYLPPPTNGNITNNYLAMLPSKVNNDSTTDKVDYNLSDKHRIFGLFSTGKYAWPNVGSLTPVTTSTLPAPYTDGRSVIEYATVAQVHDSYVITPTLVNQASLSLSRMWIPLTDPTADGNYPGKAGLTGLPAGFANSAFPDINFGGQNAPVSWDGTNSHVYNEAQNTVDAQDNILWIKGRHNFTFGFQWQTLQDNETFALNAAFTFSNNETAQFVNGALSPTTGLGYASYLLGMVDGSSNTQDSVTETGGRYKTYAAYIQDDFKVNSRLTLNLGLRWDIWGPFTEVANRMSFINPILTNPVAGGIPGALQFAGDGADSCHCRTPVQQHNINPGPRIGLAYRVGDNTVIRAGYGIFYAHAGGVGGRTNGRQGLSQVGYNGTNAQSSVATGQPAYIWDNGVPGITNPPPYLNPSYGIGYITAAAALAAGAPWAGPSTAIGMTYGDPDFGGKAPYYEDWSVNIQHSITQNLVLSAAYSGSAGHWLPGAGVAGRMTNQIPVTYLPLQGLLSSTLNATTLAQVQAVFPSFTIPFPNFTGTVAQALKPFPQYGSISDPWLDVGNSTYNSLQITLNQRLSHGVTLMFNYAYSKELDDLSGVRDPNKDFLEKGPGTIDHPSVASLAFVYQAPFGAGHMLNSSSRLLSAIISHWQFSGIFTYAGGAPLTITGTCTGGGIIDAVCYPNYNTNFSGSVWQNGTPGTGNITTTSYLNKAAFVDPPAYTEGNLARSAPYGLFAPHNADMDLSVRRDFVIREKVRVSFQADAFNVNNAVHFAAPGTGIDSATFGIFTAMANSPRKLQFSARVSF
ncbi:MAG TPA: TonB-dependent receptor [Bryobacteraceae bacterium]|nr:TonB-dependent receptor [Bryobacteraceae bacterium]